MGEVWVVWVVWGGARMENGWVKKEFGNFDLDGIDGRDTVKLGRYFFGG